MMSIQDRMDELESVRVNLSRFACGPNKGKVSLRKYRKNLDSIAKVCRELERLEIAQYYVEHPGEYQEGLKVLPPVLALLWIK